MDLKAVTASTGGHYHPDWLPLLMKVDRDESGNLSQASTGFREGQKVKIVLGGEELRSKQSECCDWDPFLNDLVGIIGTVCKVEEGHVRVQYAAYGKEWNVNPAILERVSPYSVGQVVRILRNEATANLLPSNLNGGEMGKVESIEDDGTVNVKLTKSDGTKETIGLRPGCIALMRVSEEVHDMFSKWKEALTGLFAKAALDGDLYIMNEMLTVTNLDIIDTEVESSAGRLTPLHVACRKGRLDVVRWLLDRGANLEKSDDKGRRAIYHAVKGSQTRVLELLIEKGANVNSLTTKKRMTPLQKATAKRYTECAKILVRNGCDVNLQDSDGDTPLHNAAYRTGNHMIAEENMSGVPEIVDLIVKSGRADLTLRNNKGFNVLHVAVGVDNLRMVKYLLENGHGQLAFDVDPDTNVSALHITCMKGYYEITKLLVEFAKNNGDAFPQASTSSQDDFDCPEKRLIDARDKNGVTPLMLSCYNGNYPLVELLVCNGADVNATDKLLVEFAKNNGDAFPQPSTSQEVADSPAKKLIDARTKKGMTPLMLACYKENYPIIEMLVRNGADVNAADEDGDTPIIFIGIRMRKKKKMKKSSVPSDQKSPEIKKCYDENVGHEAMRENPLLAAFCFLIQNQGKLTAVNKMGRTALSIVDDPITTGFLTEFYSPFQFSLGDDENPVLMMVDANNGTAEIPSSSSSDSIFCIHCSTPVVNPYVFQPCGHYLIMCCSVCGPVWVKRCITCNCAETDGQPVVYVKVMNQIMVFEKDSSLFDEAGRSYNWSIKQGGSRKGKDLLEDGLGGTYTRRPNSSCSWQCSKKSDTGKNKCPVVVRETNGTFHLTKGPHNCVNKKQNETFHL